MGEVQGSEREEVGVKESLFNWIVALIMIFWIWGIVAALVVLDLAGVINK